MLKELIERRQKKDVFGLFGTKIFPFDPIRLFSESDYYIYIYIYASFKNNFPCVTPSAKWTLKSIYNTFNRFNCFINNMIEVGSFAAFILLLTSNDLNLIVFFLTKYASNSIAATETSLFLLSNSSGKH